MSTNSRNPTGRWACSCQPWLTLILALLVTLGLSACGVMEQNVTLHNNGRWKAETAIELTRQELSLNQGLDDIEKGLENQRQQASAQEVKLDWNRRSGENGGVRFVVKVGYTWQVLSQLRCASPMND